LRPSGRAKQKAKAAGPKPNSTNNRLNITVVSTEKTGSSSQRFLSRKNQDGFPIKNVGNDDGREVKRLLRKQEGRTGE
jgi:hypothetical protein